MIVDANGVRINVAFSGNPSGPVVLLSHSLATDLDLWWPQLAVLEPQFRVLRYDTRGHGASDAPQGAYTLAQLADDAVAVMDVLDIETVHWVGISMGGMIGQAVALNHAERLRSLVLCDTAAVIPSSAPAYDVVWTFLVPLAIPLLLFTADLKQVFLIDTADPLDTIRGNMAVDRVARVGAQVGQVQRIQGLLTFLINAEQ